MSKSDKFASAFAALRPTGAVPDADEESAPSVASSPLQAHRPLMHSEPERVQERRGPGRPPGKRSNPHYRQITGWVRKDVHRAVLIRMLEEGRDRDLGPLIEQLLEKWLNTH
jgi:hypothetical protein